MHELINRIIKERQRDLGSHPKNLVFYQMVVGLVEEAGEVSGLLKRTFQQKDVPQIKWIEELGDVFWYLINVADMKGITLEQLIEFNRIKLEGRYGQN
jgi:NTP pyrophosphatase (non-canonical NTP hydrolase)